MYTEYELLINDKRGLEREADELKSLLQIVKSSLRNVKKRLKVEERQLRKG